MFEIFRSVRLRRLFFSETLILFLVSVLCARLRIKDGTAELYERDSIWIESLSAGLTIPVAVQLCMYYIGLYDRRSSGTGPTLFVRLALAHLVAAVPLALLYYLAPGQGTRRLAVVMAMTVSCWLLFSLRHHAEEAMKWTLRRRVLMMGTGRLSQWLGREVTRHGGAGYDLAGYLSQSAVPVGATLRGRPVLGTFAEVREIVDRHFIDEIVFAPDERRGCSDTMDLLMDVKLSGTAVWSAQQFTESLLNCLPVEILQPSSIVFDSGFTQGRVAQAAKRILDVLVSVVAILLAAPILIVTAIIIKLDSPGPILYRQPRVGKGGKLFTIYKFRSMRVQAPGEKQRLTQKNDDRITRVGNFIRMHRIDEIPQFFNVLLGDMSLVGPRPEVEYSVEEQRREIPYYDQRHAIKPGITSLGQVRFGAAVTLDEARERLKYDLYYQKNMSLIFDLSILVDTVKVVLLKMGAR